MGSTRQVEGDGHIVFHVGKELPEKGSNILLVSGRQNAQGRGVYCDEEPDLKYAGGEAYRESLEFIPIFCIPMSGVWTQRKMPKNERTVMNTKGRAVDLRGLNFVDRDYQGKEVRFYFPAEVAFFTEPSEQSERATGIQSREQNQFAMQVRRGEITYEDALRILKQTGTEEVVEGEDIKHELLRALNEVRIPESFEMRRELARKDEEEKHHVSVEGRIKMR